MTNLAFFLVLLSAVVHAGWNFFAKKSEVNKLVLLWAGQLLAGMVILPHTVYRISIEGFSLSSAYLVLISSIIHQIYFCCLGHAYELGDLSLVYPVARGVGIIGTALLASLLGIDQISLLGLTGVAVVLIGIGTIAFQPATFDELKKPLYVAISVGCAISAYSVFDKVAVDSISPIIYISVCHIVGPLLIFPWLITQRKSDIIEVLSEHKLYATSIGLASIATYGLVLWAFTLSPATYVVALRETAIAVAVVLGVGVLKEELSSKKVIGVTAILIGAGLIKIA